MTDEDYSTCLQTTESYWNYFGTSFEKFGIAKTSFDIAYSQYNRMYLKVFNALYGEGGENEVPESELRQHIEDDYYDYEYFSAPLTKTDDDNKSVDLTDEEKADLKETLEKYKTKIESGAMTVNDAATDYALKVQQDSTYQTGIKDENGMQSSYMPDAFISAIKEMNEGDVEVVESTKYMIVLHRLPIKEDEDTLLESSDNRSQLLLELKNTATSPLCLRMPRRTARLPSLPKAATKALLPRRAVRNLPKLLPRRVRLLLNLPLSKSQNKGSMGIASCCLFAYKIF